MMSLQNALRLVPDFPKPGIHFLDISPILQNPHLFAHLIEEMGQVCKKFEFSKILAIESRGFIIGSALAIHLQKGLVMVRKKGKLPGPTLGRSYDLEYGTDRLEMLSTSLEKGEKVLIVDDVLATGGTAAATCELAEELGGQVSGCVFFIELDFLKGREKMQPPVESLLSPHFS